jgi:hypothetical protein
MITRRYVMTAVLVALPLLTSSGIAIAQDIGSNVVVLGNGACPSFELAPRLGITATAATAPGLWEALLGTHGPIYDQLAKRLWPNMANLTTRAAATRDQPTYQQLLTLANSIATAAAGRIVITVPDGTVLIDTSRNDGPGDPRNNLFQNFLNKTINENHNSRVAILNAQLYPCGIGVESKKSTSTGQFEHYVAIRLGNHLDNQGTVRLSVAR